MTGMCYHAQLLLIEIGIGNLLPKLASNSQSSCINLPSAGIKDVHNHAQHYTVYFFIYFIICLFLKTKSLQG
jgi:hypothetical protein